MSNSPNDDTKIDEEAAPDLGAGQPSEAEQARARLQAELDALMSQGEDQAAVDSLDGAVASLKEVEHRNVSSVQLVALGSG